MIIRDWVQKDNDKVFLIEVESFKDPWSKSMFDDLFKNPLIRNYLIEEDNEILGYMSVIATKFVFEVINIAVKKDKRNCGLGSMLLKKAISVAKEVSAEEVLLEVRASNVSALNLYTKFGFLKDGVRKGYYPDGEDAILMSLKL